MKAKEKSQTPQSSSFHSMNWIQLVVAGIFLMSGIVNWAIFGTETGRYVELGAVLAFQGVSYFYLIGLYPGILGIYLLAKVGLEWRKISFTQEKVQLVITEQRGWFRSIHRINMETIQKIHLTNHLLSRRVWWIVGLAPYLLICLNFGIPNVKLASLSGSSLPGSIILGSGVVGFVTLLLLLCNKESMVQIQVPTGYYELRFRSLNSRIETLFHQFFLENLFIYHDSINPSHEIGIYRFDQGGFVPTQEFVIGMILGVIGGFNVLFIPTLISFQGELVSRIGFFLGVYMLIKSFFTPLEYSADVNPPQFPKSYKFKLISPRYDIWINFLQDSPATYPQFGLPIVNSGLWVVSSIILFWISFNIVRIIVGISFSPVFWWRGVISLCGYGLLFFAVVRILIRVEYHYQFEGIPAKLIRRETLHLPSHRYLFKQFCGRVFKVQFSEKKENVRLKRRYWCVLALSIGGILFFILDLLL